MAMTHREIIKSWLWEIVLPAGARIIDWGRGTKPATRYIPSFKANSMRYYGIDKLDHVGADMVADIEQPLRIEAPTFKYPPFEVAFCIEVLEHVKSPDAVLENIWHSLAQSGTLYLTVPFLFPIHHTEDYWRFTDQGIKLLLERHGFEVQKIKEIVPPTEFTDLVTGWMITAIKK